MSLRKCVCVGGGGGGVGGGGSVHTDKTDRATDQNYSGLILRVLCQIVIRICVLHLLSFYLACA